MSLTEEKKLTAKRDQIVKSGEKNMSGTKKMNVLKDWKSSSKKTFKEGPSNVDGKKDLKDIKKKPSTASKDTKDISILSKQLSSRLFAGEGASKSTKKAEKKLPSHNSRDRESREHPSTSNQLLMVHHQLLQGQLSSALAGGGGDATVKRQSK